MEATGTSRFNVVTAYALIACVTVARIVYLFFFCPLDLVPDEAHYWDWSRNLDWSYYSKGPLVAWIIRAGRELFGGLALAVTGNEMPAVRMPAVICGSLTLWGLHALTRRTLKNDRLALIVVIVGATLPALAVGSILMTIDAPFTCLWTWALVAGHSAFIDRKPSGYVFCGTLIALGVLAKYTMALWLFSALLFLAFTPSVRQTINRRRLVLMFALAALSAVPILIWNARNDWVTFRHVAVQAGVPTAGKNGGVRWFGPLEYLAGQAGLLMGYWFVAWAAAMLFFRRSTDVNVRYLWWMSLPTFALFGAVSVKSAGQINWPVTAYLSGLVLVVSWLHRQMMVPNLTFRRLTQIGFAGIIGLGALGSLFFYRSEPFRPLLAAIAGPPTDAKPFPLRQLDPTCRLRGWHHLAAAVDGVRERVRHNEGTEPLLAGAGWTLPGEIGFYCAGHPEAFSLGLPLGDRHSQYDLWRPNPVADAQAYQGRTFVYVGPDRPELRLAFDAIEPGTDVVYAEAGRPIAGWTVLICKGFRGFPADISAPTRAGY